MRISLVVHTSAVSSLCLHPTYLSNCCLKNIFVVNLITWALIHRSRLRLFILKWSLPCSNRDEEKCSRNISVSIFLSFFYNWKNLISRFILVNRLLNFRFLLECYFYFLVLPFFFDNSIDHIVMLVYFLKTEPISPELIFFINLSRV